MAGKDLVFTILGIDKATPAFNSVGDAAERAGNRVERAGSASIKAMAGMSGAAVAGGLAVGAVVGAVPLLFAGVAAAAIASNEQVSDSWGNLSSNIIDDVRDIAAPLEDDLVGAANDLGRAWEDVYPSMRRIFADPALGQGVRELTGGVGDFARNVMPGFTTAVRNSGPVMTGFRRLLGDVGTGTSDLLQNVSRDSRSTGAVIEGFGGIVRTTLGDLGGLLGTMTSSVAPHMDEIEQLFDQTTGSVVGLATTAMPILTSSTGAAVSVLNSALGVLEPIAGQLGTGLGLTLAAAGGWRVLSGATNAYTKLDLGGKLERTALSAGVMTEGLTGSATAGERVATAGSRMGSVLRGLGSALPVVGIAAAAVGVAIELSAQRMEYASDRGNALAESMIKGGAEAETARVKLAELGSENERLAAKVTELSALVSGTEAQGYREELGRTRKQLEENNTTLDAAKTKYKEIRETLGGADLAQVQYNEAVAAFGVGSTEAAAAGIAWRAALDADREKQNAAAAATRTHTEKLIEQQGIMLGAVGSGLNYKAALLATESAQKSLAEAVKTGGKDSLEARQAGVQYEQQLLATVAALGEKVKAENAGKSASEQATLVTAAQAAEILRLASAAGNDAPAALTAMVQGLDSATLSALGVTGRINEAGDAVLRLPDGKEVVITGQNVDALRKIQEVNDRRLLEKTLWINAVMRADQKTAAAFGDSGRARGGPVAAGEVVEVGEEGRELAVFDSDVQIIPHSRSEEILAGLNRSTGIGTSGSPGAGAVVVEKHYHLTVVNAANSEVDLRSQYTRIELLDGTG